MMDKKEFLIKLGALHREITTLAGCKTNEECRHFLKDNVVSAITLEQSFKKFEPSKNNINETVRLSKINDKNLEELKILKAEAEKLNLMKCKFEREVYYNMGYYKPV